MRSNLIASFALPCRPSRLLGQFQNADRHLGPYKPSTAAMGKRKRHDRDSGEGSEWRAGISASKTGISEEMKAVELHSKSRFSQTAFKPAWTATLDRQRSEIAGAIPPTEDHGGRQHQRKEHKKRKHSHGGPSKTNSAAADDSLQPAAEDQLDRRFADFSQHGGLAINGNNRSQRRRKRRKLISMGLVPKDARRESSDVMQQESRPHPMTQALDTTSSAGMPAGRKDVTGTIPTPLPQQALSESASECRQAMSWAEKPTAKKAMARQLETTPLMQTPQSETANKTKEAGSWTDKPIGRAAMARQLATTPLMQPPHKGWDDRAVLLGSSSSTPWQRSATNSGQLVLPKSTALEEESESDSASEDATSDGAAIYTKRVSQSGHIVRSRRGFGPGLREVLAQPKAKRTSLSSRAHSVPAAFVDGDITERFRRFSAAAHGKTADVSSDGSSETTSDGNSDEEEEQSSQRVGQAETSRIQEGVLEADTEDEAVRHDRPTKFSDIMSRTHPAMKSNNNSKRTVSGSELSGRRSSSLPVSGEQAVNEQRSVYEGSRDTAHFPAMDDESFDAHQAIEDVFNTEMRLTRELPAGKKEPSHDLEQEDESLTQESSDRGVTRSASKPATLAKRVDSAVPSPDGDSVIVRSMRLPEQGGGPVQSGDRDEGADKGGNMAEVGLRDGEHFEEEYAERPARDPSSSPLSELSQIPSPPLKEVNEILSGLAREADALHQEDNDTIVVAPVEQTPESKKKRKMTGRTSKHFSASKAKKMTPKEMSAPAASPDMDAKPGSSTGGPTTTADPRYQKRRRAERTRGLLDDLRADFDAASSGGERETENTAVGGSDVPGGRSAQKGPPKPRKRSRRSSGTLANLDASNIIDGRPRRSAGRAHVNVGDLSDSAQLDEDGVDNDPAAGASDDVEVETRPKKRARMGGKITDLDTSNILERRSRRSRKEEEEQAQEEQGPQADDPPEVDVAATETPREDAPTKSKAKRKSTGRRSSYFLPTKPALDPNIIDRVDFYNTTGKKPRVPAGTSTAPVPPIDHERFGIIQEKLWREPFWLLIAVTFLNKTTGRAAAPIFWQLKEKYESPEALAEADQTELCEMIWHLGLQTQRSKRLIAMAKAWVERAPERGKRWRTLHYPRKGDGKELKEGVAVEEDADEVEGAVEIGQFPGCGPYAMDSWRIFCRDVLRGVAEDYNGKGADEGFVPEWQRVLPGDKELRACLRWMWLRERWIWNHDTGEKRRATKKEMEKAVRGEMEVADAQEGKFAAQAAGVEVGAQQAGEAEQDAGEDGGGEQTELTDPGPSESASNATRTRRVAKTKKRGATPDETDGDASDNIVVESQGKKRRVSGRTARPRRLED